MIESKYRELKVLRSFRMYPSHLRALKKVATDRDIPLQRVLEEAIDGYLFRQHQNQTR